MDDYTKILSRPILNLFDLFRFEPHCRADTVVFSIQQAASMFQEFIQLLQEFVSGSACIPGTRYAQSDRPTKE